MGFNCQDIYSSPLNYPDQCPRLYLQRHLHQRFTFRYLGKRMVIRSPGNRLGWSDCPANSPVPVQLAPRFPVPLGRYLLGLGPCRFRSERLRCPRDRSTRPPVPHLVADSGHPSYDLLCIRSVNDWHVQLVELLLD